jgi:hypothetical protein
MGVAREVIIQGATQQGVELAEAMGGNSMGCQTLGLETAE